MERRASRPSRSCSLRQVAKCVGVPSHDLLGFPHLRFEGIIRLIQNPGDSSCEVNRCHLTPEYCGPGRKTRRKTILETLSDFNESLTDFDQFADKVEPALVKMQVVSDRPLVSWFAFLAGINSEFGQESSERIRESLRSHCDEIAAAG